MEENNHQGVIQEAIELIVSLTGELSWQCGHTELRLEDREKLVDRAQRVIAALKERQVVDVEEWRPIETAPKDGRKVFIAGYVNTIKGFDYGAGMWNPKAEVWTDFVGGKPTHRKPLSPPPQNTTTEENS